MALFLKDSALPPPEIGLPAPALELGLTKHNLIPPPPLSLFPNPYSYNRLNLLNPTITCPLRIPSPPSIPTLIPSREPEVICEAAASLLFMNVKWAKNVPAFASLSLPDRLLLLEESWRDLFVIGSAQFLYPVDLKILYDSANSRLERNDLEVFQAALTEIMKLRPDSNEYACLRAIVLFKTSFGDISASCSPIQNESNPKRLQDPATVGTMRDHTQAILNEVRFLKKKSKEQYF